jgi:hypothetical protein
MATVDMAKSIAANMLFFLTRILAFPYRFAL